VDLAHQSLNLHQESCMSPFIVHGVPGSPFGRAVLATLVEKNAPFRFAAVTPGTLKSEAHLARHAFGRVPVLEHEGFDLYETAAILRYLDRVLPNPALTPADAKAAARMDQVMGISDWYLFQGVGNKIGFQRVVAPMLGMPTDEAVCEAALPQARQVMKELSRLLGERDWFAGTFSLADLAAYPHLDILAMTPEWKELSALAPNVVAWLARAATRRCFTETTVQRVIALASAA
jgi:glutathione S-transferase